MCSGIDVEVDVESHGQRRRCRRGMMRGHHGPWFHGMRGGGGGGCGPWGMRGGGPGRFGCHLKGRWCGPPAGAAWCHKPPFAAAAAAAAAASQPPPPPTGPQAPENPATQAEPRRDPDTNAETGEMSTGGQSEVAATITDQEWTLVNDGGTADVDGATTGVQQLHMSGAPAAENITGTYNAHLTWKV